MAKDRMLDRSREQTMVNWYKIVEDYQVADLL